MGAVDSSTKDVVRVNMSVTRKTRVPITIGAKNTICRLRTDGLLWSTMIPTFPVDVSQDAARKIYRRKARCLALSNDDTTATRTTPRQGHFPGIDKPLVEWNIAVERLDHATVAVSVGLLQAKAVEIGRRLGLDTFFSSRGYFRGFLFPKPAGIDAAARKSRRGRHRDRRARAGGDAEETRGIPGGGHLQHG